MTRRTYERIAPFYDLLDLPFEHRRYRPLRRQLFEGLSGTVLDAGVGTGRNMPFYPEGARVIGIDISPAMLARAARRRDRLGVAVELGEMDVCRTGFPDHLFDAVVATFLFCVLPAAQQLPALREIARIAKPGGTVRLLEYAHARSPGRRAIGRLWAPYVRWAFGAAFDRDTERHIPAAGLEITEQRFVFRDQIKLIAARPKAPAA